MAFYYLCKTHLVAFLWLPSTWGGKGKTRPRSMETTVLKTVCFAYLFQAGGHTDTEKQQARETRFQLYSGWRVLTDAESRGGIPQSWRIPNLPGPGEFLMLKDCRMEPHNNPQNVWAEITFRPSLYGALPCHRWVSSRRLSTHGTPMKFSMWKGLKPKACVFVMETQQWPHDPGLYLCRHQTWVSKQSSECPRSVGVGRSWWKAPSGTEVPETPHRKTMHWRRAFEFAQVPSHLRFLG